MRWRAGLPKTEVWRRCPAGPAVGGDIVVIEGPGSGQGQVITGYGPSGIRAESGARALGGVPSDLGIPVTHEMINQWHYPGPADHSLDVVPGLTLTTLPGWTLDALNVGPR
jgi:hypothetical protein